MANASTVTQTYVPDRAGVESIATSPQMKAALLAIVTEGKKHAESISPRRTGNYVSKFDARVEESTDATKLSAGRKRAVGILENTADYAAAVEFGTEASVVAGQYRPATSAQRVLGRTQEALRAAGRAEP